MQRRLRWSNPLSERCIAGPYREDDWVLGRKSQGDSGAEDGVRHNKMMIRTEQSRKAFIVLHEDIHNFTDYQAGELISENHSK